jgi:hypothetical protein
MVYVVPATAVNFTQSSSPAVAKLWCCRDPSVAMTEAWAWSLSGSKASGATADTTENAALVTVDRTVESLTERPIALTRILQSVDDKSGTVMVYGEADAVPREVHDVPPSDEKSMEYRLTPQPPPPPASEVVHATDA